MSRKKLTERQFVNAIVDKLIIPRSGRLNLHGEIGKLRNMSLTRLISWARKYETINAREASQLSQSSRLKHKIADPMIYQRKGGALQYCGKCNKGFYARRDVILCKKCFNEGWYISKGRWRKR